MDAPMKDLKTRQIEALEKSITHWKENEKQKLAIKVDLSPESCECCNQFLKEEDLQNCEECPIFERTLKRFCRQTPYIFVSEERYKILAGRGLKQRKEAPVTQSLRSAIKHELDFLQALKKELKKELEKELENELENE
jgi:hypothetical protein